MENKKLFAAATALILLMVGAGIGIATDGEENPHASAKTTAAIGYLDVFSIAASDPDHQWDFDVDFPPEIITQTIKTANQKDLIIDVSLQTGVYTYTQVKSKNMVKDTSMGMANIYVWIWVDDHPVYPYFPIIFDSRIQVLSAELQGELALEGDMEAGYELTVVDNETIELFIGTMSAHSFNFIVPDLDSGMHTVRVFVWATTAAGSMQGSASAIAAVGLGSIVVEEVRMIQNEDIYI